MSITGKITITSESPIAVFDSGIGGVSVLRELYKLMPNENYLYFGDSANAPYGTKTTEEIKDLTIKNIEMLKGRGCKAAVIACNTATSAAAADLRTKYPDFPIIGLEPALKPAALSMEHPTVVVMATPLTLREKKFAELVERFKDKAEIIKLPAPKIVNLVESGKENSKQMEYYLRYIFEPYCLTSIDCVVLGCTHFPFAKKAINEYFDGNVKLFDGGEGTAKQTRRVLEQINMLAPEDKTGIVTFENSDFSKISRAKELFYDF